MGKGLKGAQQMQIPQIILQQTLVMFLYMLAGFVLYRKGIITKQGSKDMASLLINLVTPIVLLNSFCVESSPEKWAELGSSTLVGVICITVTVLASKLAFPHSPMDNFSSTFSNIGFFGIPLVQAVLGYNAVFYMVGFLAVFNLVQWTYGSSLMSGKKLSFDVKTLVLNPYMAAAVTGLLLFSTGLGTKLPVVVSTALEGISNVNSPLAMMVLGVYLAQTDFSKLFTVPRLYWVSVMRLVVIPLLTLAALYFFPAARDIKLTLLIVAATPVAANTAVYAQLHGQDYTYACRLVALSTLLTVFTLPLFMSLADKVLM